MVKVTVEEYVKATAASAGVYALTFFMGSYHAGALRRDEASWR